MQVIHDLLANHSAISRSVTNLPNGIRTVTEANDPRLTFLIRQHVVTMVERVKTGAAFGCGVETPAVRALFQARDRIDTRIEPTARGVALVQTSDDPAAVRALQQHAAEVSEMARSGLAARGEGMMRRRAMMGSEMGCGVVTEEEETARQP